jgi:predicted dehydrogenase
MALQEYPKAELAAVAWHNGTQLAAFTGSFKISGYSDYGELLKHEDIDLVHIATPVSEISDCTIRSARAGKHIVLGKPMAMTMEQADQMVEAVEKSGVKCVAFQGIKRFQRT